MERKRRLRTRNDFQSVFKTGKRMNSPLFDCIIRNNGLSYSRFGLIVSRAVHKRAVVRNRIRRRAREWLRKHEHGFKTTIDFVLIFKKSAAQATRRTFYEELESTILFTRRIR